MVYNKTTHTSTYVTDSGSTDGVQKQHTSTYVTDSGEH